MALPNDMRHFRLSRRERLESRLDSFNGAVWSWMGSTTVFGLSWGTLIILCIIGAAVGLFFGFPPNWDGAFGLR